MKTKALKAALPYTLPICIGFLFIGLSYGFLMSSLGFSFIYPMITSFLIFAGAMEFVTANLLLATFNPLQAFFLAIMVNARHVFYGISMLEKYKGTGWKKIYLIFGMCDESFSINCTVSIPEEVDRGWFMFFITFLNHLYWVVGATLGGLLGSIVNFDTTGIEFILTALFIVMFVEQWKEANDHFAACVGVACAFVCLAIFGGDSFMLPSMLSIIVCFSIHKLVQKEGVTK